MISQEMIVKGLKGGVLITLPPVRWYQQIDMLITRIQTQERFFKGGRIAIDVGPSDWNEDQLERLLRDLSNEGVCLWAVLSTSPITLESAENFNIPVSINFGKTKEQSEKIDEKTASIAYTTIQRQLSKQEKLTLQGNYIFIGDVPHSAELETTGSLIVWGKVEGTVRASHADTEEDQICILQYSGEGIFFGDKLVELPKKKSFTGLMIRQKEGEVLVEERTSKRFGLK